VPGAFHGRVPGPVWPDEDSHSPWTDFRGPRHLKQGANVALTVKNNQPTLRQQMSSQFEGKRHIPFTTKTKEKRHGRETR